MSRRRPRRQRSQTANNTIGGKTGALTDCFVNDTSSLNSFIMILVRTNTQASGRPFTVITTSETIFLDTTKWRMTDAPGNTREISQARLTGDGNLTVLHTTNRTTRYYLTIPAYDAMISAATGLPFGGGTWSIDAP